MYPSGFERLARRLLRESGLVKVELTGKPGDGGIDGSGVLRMNLISFQMLFQCKRVSVRQTVAEGVLVVPAIVHEIHGAGPFARSG